MHQKTEINFFFQRISLQAPFPRHVWTYFFILLMPDTRIREINLLADRRVSLFGCGKKKHVNKASTLLVFYFLFRGASPVGLVGPSRVCAHIPSARVYLRVKPSTRVDILYSSRRRRGDTPICQLNTSAFFLRSCRSSRGREQLPR